MFECDFCDKEFKSERGKKSHETQVHEEKKKKRYRKNNPVECPYCEKRFKEYNSLVRHAPRVHDDIDPPQLYVDYHLNGEWPTCDCGCGEKVSFQKGSERGYGFANYKQGHYSREMENGFWTEKGLKKSAETRRKQFEEGDREPWNKGMSLEENPENEGLQKLRDKMLKENNPERAKKISEALTGRDLSDAEKEWLEQLHEINDEYWSKEEHREEQRQKRLDYISSEDFAKRSGLEETFEEMLENQNIKYETQEPLDGRFAYDFYLPKTDTYIEVHGDFWHCNPDTEHAVPTTEPQKKNLQNDKMKENWCQSNDKQLLVFWENDIENSKNEVIEQLNEHIK
jgi:G:T-mismatch repair DNA endonuclease (very short patch repair protein)